MEDTDQNKPLLDRELNIQKVQILLSYCHTKINALYAYLITFIIGFAIFIGTLFYDGYLNVFRYITADPLLQQISSIIVFAVILYLLMITVKPKFREINADNDRCLQLIDELFTLIDKGYPIPPLSDLKKTAFPQKTLTRLLRGKQTKEVVTPQIFTLNQSITNEQKPAINKESQSVMHLDNSDIAFILVPSILGIVAFIVSFSSFSGLFENFHIIQTVDPEVINGFLAISGIVFAFQAFIFKKPKKLLRRFVFAIIFVIEVLALSYICINYINDVTTSTFPSVGTFFFVSFSLIFTLANTAFFIIYDLFNNEEI